MMDTITNLRTNKTFQSILLRPDSARAAWRNPQDSVGNFIGNVGRESCWIAVGPVRSTFLALSQEIKHYLDAHTEAVPYWVTWSIYMIGKHATNSVPTIIFCCENEAHRKDVQDKVRMSGILDRYPRGIALKHLLRAPDYGQLVQLASESLPGDSKPSGTDTTQLAGERSGKFSTNDHNLSIPNELPIFPISVRCAVQNPKLGATLHIDMGADNPPRKSTAGSKIYVGRQALLMTAAHAFSQVRAQSSSPPFDEGELHFSDNEDESGSTCQASSDPKETRSVSTLQSIIPTHSKDSENTPGEEEMLRADAKSQRDRQEEDAFKPLIGYLLYSTEQTTEAGLDFALVSLTDDNSNYNLWLARKFPRFCAEEHFLRASLSDRVKVLTGSSGKISGTVSLTPLFLRVPGSGQYQQMYIATLEVPLQRGDCGSVVIDIDTNQLLGHVVAGSFDTRTAFLVPAFLSFKHIRRNFSEIRHAIRESKRETRQASFFHDSVGRESQHRRDLSSEERVPRLGSLSDQASVKAKPDHQNFDLEDADEDALGGD